MAPDIPTILHLLLWIHPAGGGIQTYLSTLRDALAPSQISISAGALMPGLPTPYVPEPSHLGEPGRPLWFNAWRYLRWAVTAVSQAGVVHIHGVTHLHFLLGCWACLLRGVPYVVSPHGQITDWVLRAKPVKRGLYLRWLAAPLLRRAQAIVATTDREKDEIAKYVANARICVVPPAVVAHAARASGVAGEGGTGNRLLQVVFVGMLCEQKGLATLLEAVALLRDRGSPVSLKIIGRQSQQGYEDAMRGLVVRLHLEQMVQFAGYLQGAAKHQALREADVFALPSLMENFSFATAEAMALGLPVVVSTEVAIADTIRRNACGSVVAPEDPAALAAALGEYADPEFRRARAERAAETAHKEFTMDAMRRSLEALYRSAAQARTAR